MSPAQHPLDPLTAAELTEAAAIVVAHVEKEFPSQTVYFKALSLAPPLKAVLAPFLDSVAAGEAPTPLPRQAEALLGVRSSASAIEYYECFLTLAAGPNVPGTVDKFFAIDKSFHVGIDAEEMARAEAAILANEEFKAAIASLRLPEGATVVADTWIFGESTSSVLKAMPNDSSRRRLVQAQRSLNPLHDLLPPLRQDGLEPLLLSSPSISFHPRLRLLPPRPRLDCHLRGRVDRHDRRSSRWLLPLEQAAGHRVRSPASGCSGDITSSGPQAVPRCSARGSELQARRSCRELAEGAPRFSFFQVFAHLVPSRNQWQFHIGFNYREGPVISDVRYDGRLVFHRLSVSVRYVPFLYDT